MTRKIQQNNDRLIYFVTFLANMVIAGKLGEEIVELIST